MYAVYHGPGGPHGDRAARAAAGPRLVAAGLRASAHAARRRVLRHPARRPRRASPAEVLAAPLERGLNLRRYADGVGVACDETTSADDVAALLECFAGGELPFALDELTAADAPALPAGLARARRRS
jgi:glycine dehydrogenase